MYPIEFSDFFFGKFWLKSTQTDILLIFSSFFRVKIIGFKDPEILPWELLGM